MLSREQAVEIAAIGMNFPNRAGVGLRSSEREPQASAVGGKTNIKCPAGNRNQFPLVRSICVSEENVRPLGERELLTVWRPHSPVSDNIRKMAGAACGQRLSGKLRSAAT
jgi:hypothetical protein